MSIQPKPALTPGQKPVRKLDSVVALDVGTSKISCLFGVFDADEAFDFLPEIEIIGFGSTPSAGVRKGVVVDVAAATQEISKVIQHTERMTGQKITDVIVSGGQWVNGQGMLPENLKQCVERAGLKISEAHPRAVASAESCVSLEQKRKGIAVVDIGGGTSEIAIFKNGTLVHTALVPIGGNHITNDLAMGLRINPVEAEELKIKHGCCLGRLVNAEESVEISGIVTGGDSLTRQPLLISKKLIAEIIEPRVEEIFSLIQREIKRSNFQESLSAGIILTGGATLLKGMSELAEFVFEMPSAGESTGELSVRRGIPRDIKGPKEIVSSPKYATGVGLLKYGAKNIANSRLPIRDELIYDEENFYNKVRGSMRAWIKDLF